VADGTKQGSEAHCTMTYIRTCTVQPSGQASISKASTISSSTARSWYWSGRSRGSSSHPIPLPGPPSRPLQEHSRTSSTARGSIVTPQGAHRRLWPCYDHSAPKETEHAALGLSNSVAMRSKHTWRTWLGQSVASYSTPSTPSPALGGLLPGVFVPSPAHINSLCLS
jgi:hypothetical protein